MKILLDVDGVIANFYAGIADHLNKTLNAGLDINKDPSKYNIYDWSDTIPKGLMDSEITKWTISGGYKNLPDYPGAKEFTENLINNHDVHTVTARVGDFQNLSKSMVDIVKHDTNQWFKGKGIPYTNLVFEHNKIDYCKNNGINIIIEDKPLTAEKADGANLKCILLKRTYNENTPPSEYIKFAETYDDILNILRALQ